MYHRDIILVAIKCSGDSDMKLV